MTTIDGIFRIPDAVRQGDFVLRLTEGLQAERRQQTLEQYVVTPQLVQAFEQALGLIGAAVRSGSSKGAYLDGSFGSGKSHFMAVLDMVLEGDSAARAIPELAGPVRQANEWWEGGKYLVVPLHMIGATSMEQKILGGYAAHVRALHPDAPTPGFFRSTELLADAERLRQTMGDERFFAALGSAGSADGWGSLGGGWDADNYAAATRADPMDKEHQRLVGELVDAFFQHLRTSGDDGNLMELDRGLAVMAQHATALGYSAVVLFLDELILWLASRAQDHAFLSREGPKVSKLVEAQHADRPIPVVSFIARQRDLRELVGESLPGAQHLAFADVLQWWEARFDRIVLEDRNLPAIIERRLLQPKGPQQKQELQHAFATTAQTRQEVLDILLTQAGDKDMFEQVYPFSPALVQVLVALSSLLQRERTALKLMLQLLVEHRKLPLGDLIAVGDLFDVIMSGDEPFDTAIKHQFDRARQIWTRKLRPMLEAEHGLSAQELEDGGIDEAAARRYSSDAGLLKTLVLSALVPEVEALRNLTPLRLAALNHGTVRSPLPGGESSVVLSKVRQWAAQVGEIQLSGEGANPGVSLHLTGVDVEGVLENARAVDSPGNRMRTVRDLLFADIGMDSNAGALLTPEYPFLWRGTARRAEIVLQNVYQSQDETLRPGEGAWRVLVDYPFDESGHGPADGRARLGEFRQAGGNEQTLVWLPSHLNDAALRDLGRLGILNHVLGGNRLDEYGAHLQPSERHDARAILKNQRDQLEEQVIRALKQAYGIAQGTTQQVHSTLALDDHFQSLATGLTLQPPPGGSFKDSLEHLLGQALSFQYPAHPRFDGELRNTALRKTLQVLQQAAAADDGRAAIERGQRDEIRRIVTPLKLADCGEAHLVLLQHWSTHFTRKMASANSTSPTVGALREWLDEPDPMGLPTPVADLVILAWAAQTGRTPYLHGAPVAAEIGRLHRESELREQALPDKALWDAAVQRAAAIFGEAGSGSSCNAGNVATLSQAVREHAANKKAAVQTYQQKLTARLAVWLIDPDCDRMRTANACSNLLSALQDADSDPIEVLADATPATSEQAMGVIMARAQALVGTLQSPAWETLETFHQLQRTDEPAQQVLAAVNGALGDDEHVTALEAQVTTQQRAALRLMAPPPAPTTPASPTQPRTPQARLQTSRRALSSSELKSVFDEIEEQLQADENLRADIEYRVYPAPKKSEGSNA